MLPSQIVALLLSEHAREPFVGPVLAYGEQFMNIAYPGALWLFESVGLVPEPAGMVDPPPEGERVTFARLALLMGLGKVRTLDVSDYQGADIVADLNNPVPESLLAQFGLIVDGGTMEHVFDIRQGMKNTADMLRPGGRVVHTSPVNNYVNHGFVQISPTLYHDYYIANKFDDVRGIMVVQPRDGILDKRWNLFTYEHTEQGGVNSFFCSEETMLAIYFTAKKTADSTSTYVPIQSYFVRLEAGDERLSGQVAITHDAMGLLVRAVAEVPETLPNLDRIVHAGFGNGRPISKLKRPV